MLDKRYNYREVEKRQIERWVKEKIFRFEKDANKPVYSIDTPPPTVSGSLHIGHIFSYTQAEIIARYKRMNGFNVFYPFGFDDNGLPTERLVEKELGILASKFSRTEFTKMCIETTKKYEEEFKNLCLAIGFSADWDLQYETISESTQMLSQKSFIELAKKGKAYLKEEPVLWCTNCRTSIAQAELDTAEKEAYFNWIYFMSGNQKLEIATTRPELLAGCVALFVNPGDKRYTHLIGKSALVPLYEYEIPVIADKKVDMDKGSGMVMCATFGDLTDVEWFKEYNLGYRDVLGPDGKINEKVELIGGLEVAEARKKIIEELERRGLLLKSLKITHFLGFHERCGKEVEIIPSRQWYIDILSEKERFIKAADAVNWYPAYMKGRYLAWVENLKWDWCISRQRYFGVPFPVWYCKNCNEAVFANEHELPVNPLESMPEEVCKCGCREYIPESAVMDTWATSSITPYINAESIGSEEFIPMSMRTQAHEIIRTWTFYTIVRSLYQSDKMPWKDIMVCGYVMAGKGEKISKSKGNSKLTPMELIERYSADGVRYWSANAKLGTDTMFDSDELEASSRFLTKLWNSARFCLMHLKNYRKGDGEIVISSDKWIIERLKKLSIKLRELLDNYEIGSARHELDTFFWSDFCDNYIELVKDRLYKPEVHGEAGWKSACKTIYIVLLEILKMYAIYVPFISEEIYQAYFREKEGGISLHTEQWMQEACFETEYIEFGESIKRILEDARRYKSNMNLSLKAPVEELRINFGEGQYDMYISAEMDIKTCTNAQKIELFGGTD